MLKCPMPPMPPTATNVPPTIARAAQTRASTSGQIVSRRGSNVSPTENGRQRRGTPPGELGRRVHPQTGGGRHQPHRRKYLQHWHCAKCFPFRPQQTIVVQHATPPQWHRRRCSTYVFVIHVGGTRCVTSSTDNIVNIHARITLTVECIRVFVYVYLMVEYNAESDQD